jgi:chromate transporter
VPPRAQVVLPMLSSEVVSTGWMSESDFLTGLALIQALPGPLFNLSAYIGT